MSRIGNDSPRCIDAVGLSGAPTTMSTSASSQGSVKTFFKKEPKSPSSSGKSAASSVKRERDHHEIVDAKKLKIKAEESLSVVVKHENSVIEVVPESSPFIVKHEKVEITSGSVKGVKQESSASLHLYYSSEKTKKGGEESQGSWSCPACTLINRASFLACDCCGQVKPHDPDTTSFTIIDD